MCTHFYLTLTNTHTHTHIHTHTHTRTHACISKRYASGGSTPTNGWNSSDRTRRTTRSTTRWRPGTAAPTDCTGVERRSPPPGWRARPAHPASRVGPARPAHPWCRARVHPVDPWPPPRTGSITLYVCMYVCIYVNVCVYACVCIYVCVSVYVCMYIFFI